MFAGAACVAAAGDVETWQALDVPVARWSRVGLDAALHTRERQGMSDYYDTLLFVNLRYTISDRIGLFNSFCLRDNESRPAAHDAQERVVFGGRYQISDGRLGVSAGMQYERHFSVLGRRDINRLRYIVDIQKTRRHVIPFISTEIATQDSAFYRSRTITGIRWQGDWPFILETAYQFESIYSGRAYVPRHAIRTSIRWRGLPLIHH